MKDLRSYTETKAQEEDRARAAGLLNLDKEFQERLTSGLALQQQTVEDLHAAVECKLTKDHRANADVLSELKAKMSKLDERAGTEVRVCRIVRPDMQAFILSFKNLTLVQRTCDCQSFQPITPDITWRFGSYVPIILFLFHLT